MSASSPGTGNLDFDKRVGELEEANCFSFEETRIGTWTDGKPLYRKMIDFGILSNNSTKQVPHQISNISTPHINIGESYFYDVPYTDSGTIYSFIFSGYIENVYATRNNVLIKSNVNATNFGAVICLEYTKTTD